MGLGAGRRGVGGGEGGSGGPAALRPGGALRCSRGLFLQLSHLYGPPPSAAVRAGVSLGAPGGPSRGRRSARANWGGGGGGGGSWRAAWFPLETQSFCSGRRRRRGGLVAYGSRSGWEVRGRPWPGPWSAGAGGGDPPGRGGVASRRPLGGRLVPRLLPGTRPARPLAPRSSCPAPLPFRREMPATFPLSLQPLDRQMRLCALLGVFSTAPSSLGGQG